jgi:cytochrome b involved in lipid metabolism
MSRIITAEECAKHTKRGDTWIVVHGHVFDVSKWMEDHPGTLKELYVKIKFVTLLTLF